MINTEIITAEHSESPNKVDLFNRTVQNIVEASVTDKLDNYTKDIKPLWNLIDPLVRLALLNQTQVQQLWNATESLSKNKTKLEWASLPDDVKSFLLEQSKQNIFLNLTFAQWGWVALDSCFATNELNTLLTDEQINIIPAVQSILNRLSFDQLINTTAVKTSLYSHHRILMNFENNESFEMDLPYFDFPLREFTASLKQPTVYAVYSQGLGNLITFLIQIKYFL